jgi:hypothetical protein
MVILLNIYKLERDLEEIELQLWRELGEERRREREREREGKR